MHRVNNVARWFVLVALAGCGGTQAARSAEPTPTPAPTVVSPTADDAGTATDDASAASVTNTNDASGGVATAGDASTAQAAADAGPPIELPPMPANLQGPPRPWAQMNGRQRGAYMDDHIVPVMSELLRAYDAQRYANVNCATCHGRNARQVNFHMPNTLPPLHPFGSPEARRAFDENPRIFHFMRERVVPVMSTLLGIPRWSRENPNGFGCMNCHSNRGEHAAAPVPTATTSTTPAAPAATTPTTR